MNMLLSVAVALRLLNPHDVAVETTLHCGDETRIARLEAHELRDVEACQSAEALVPIGAVQMFLDEEQREWQQSTVPDLCGAQPPAMNVPSFACRNGVATAYVPPVAGASYAWGADGATIVAGASTNYVSLQFSDAPTATLSCVISTPDCTLTATGIIAVREPIAVRSFSVPAETNANRPLTITWSYTPGTEPAAQILTGDLFPEPVTLDPAARSFTITPETAGSRTVELRASYATTVTKRRRRAMGGGVSASECPAATAAARVDVKGCIARDPVVEVPEDAAAGETFEAKVADLAEGDEVDWSADNGTIQPAGGKRALVTAGTSGKTTVHARVQRGPGCFATASASVVIIRPLNACSLPPSAALSLVSESCNRAVVRATFTGTPPFAGRWSDGRTFRATGKSVDHEFTAPGTYGMTLFHDGSCFGTVSGSPSATMKKPTVTVAGVEGCAGGEVAATFTGTPPFKGTWSDGQPFTSATTTLTRTVPSGTWSVRDVTDATCPIKTFSNAVTFGPAPRASVQPSTVCYIPADSYFFPGNFELETTGGKPPYVYEFTDGHVVTTSLPSTQTTRPSANEVQRWELKRVTANGCEAVLDNRATTVYRRTGVQLDGTPLTVCTLTNVEIASIWQPSPGGRIEWGVYGVSFTDEDPEIVGDASGPKITIRATHPTYAEVSVRTRWEGFCRYDLSPRVRVRFVKCD